jgi:MSHA biogenesis protein MshQ
MSISSPTIAVGRFVPDHFDIVSLVTPVLRTFNSSTCTPRSFTYLGQPFGYATAPQATVLARNRAGATTVNYPDAKLGALVRAQTYTPLVTATPGVDSSAATLPAITPNGNGTAVLAAQASDLLKVVRPATTPLAPFNASIGLAWSVNDSSDATVAGNGTIATSTGPNMANIAFDAGNEFRFGLLKLGSAYGSELVNLAVPLELQYWNSNNSFATNAADSCTTLATSSLALGTYRSKLAACETAPGATSVSFSGGRGLLRMLPPGSGNSGSVDGTINLGAVAAGQQCSAIGATASAATTANMPWLQGKSAAATTYSVNPSARFSFGQYRSPLIHLREVY